MPIYVYRCDSCGENNEVLQKVGDAPLRSCPHCGAENLRKVIAPVGVIFKGSGFHKNDYTGSGGGAKKADSASSTSESGGEKKSEGGTDSKKSESTTSPTSSDSGGGGGGSSTSGNSGKVA